MAVARENGFMVIQVNISCSPEEHKKRITSEERARGERDITPETVDELVQSEATLIDPARHTRARKHLVVKQMHLDSTKLTPEQSAGEIRSFCSKVVESMASGTRVKEEKS